jgi:hypothetical protein
MLLNVMMYVYSFYYYFFPYVCRIVSSTLNCLVFCNKHDGVLRYDMVIIFHNARLKMGWRPFILTEVFCCVLYFLSSTGCHGPKRTCSLQFDVLMPANVNITEKSNATVFTLLCRWISHFPPNIDIYQNRRLYNTEVFNLYKLCSWQLVVK